MAAKNNDKSKKGLVSTEPAKKPGGGGGGASPQQQQRSSLTTTTSSSPWKRLLRRLRPRLWIVLVLLYAIACLWWEELRHGWMTSSTMDFKSEQEQRRVGIPRPAPPSPASTTSSTMSRPPASSTSDPTKKGIISVTPFNASLFDTSREFCVEWHIDTDDWWTHRPDWMVTIENETHYCMSPIQDQNVTDGAEKAQFLRNLYDNQFRNNCSNLHMLHMVNQGWGSDLRNVYHGLAYGMDQHRPVQFYLYPFDRRPWLYTVGPQATTSNGTREFVNQEAADQKPACPTKNMECYFLPLTNCPPFPVPEMHDPTPTQNLDSQKAGWYLEYATRTKTFLRYRIYRFITERAPAMRTPCTVIHVRRADVVINPFANVTRRYHPLEDYIDGATTRGTAFAPHKTQLLHENILLMTDDQNAISEAHFKYPRYHWMYINRTRHRGAEGGFENQIPSGDPVEEVTALLAEFSLVRHCTSIIHTFSSLPYYLRAIMQSQHGTNGVMKLDIDDDQHGTGTVWKAGNGESTRHISRAYDG
jgi:hypothetical protein